MITFKEILDDELPIGCCRIAASISDAGIVHSLIGKDWAHIPKGCVKVIRFILAHIHKDEPVENAHMAGEQAVFSLVKVFRHKPC